MGKSNASEEDGESGIFRSHSLHKHQLRLQRAEGPYKCNGCKQPGSRRCFKCPEHICDFYLHTDCFQAEHSSYKTHKFMKSCKFIYHDSPLSVTNKYCDACGLDIEGFRYECNTHGENPHHLHPTCVNMDFEMDWDGLRLELHDKVETKCLHCKQRYPAEECIGFTGWKWVSHERYYGFPNCLLGKKICFHVKCMNEIQAPKEEKYDEYQMEYKCSLDY